MSIDATTDFWARAFAAGGLDVETLWGSEESQQSRFAAFVESGAPWHGARVLDVGCGLGDFYGYLTSHRVQIGAYMGVDLMPEAVMEAKRRWPDTLFMVGDWRDAPVTADIVCASGIFGAPIPRWESYARKTLHAMYERAEKAVVVNFLSTEAPVKDHETAQFADPEKVVGWALALTNKFKLLHHYRENDFTLVLEKT